MGNTAKKTENSGPKHGVYDGDKADAQRERSKLRRLHDRRTADPMMTDGPATGDEAWAADPERAAIQKQLTAAAVGQGGAFAQAMGKASAKSR